MTFSKWNCILFYSIPPIRQPMTAAQPSGDDLFLFENGNRVLVIQASNQGDLLGRKHVLRKDLERLFGKDFPPHSTTFSYNGVQTSYETGPDNAIIVPERLVCIPGHIIEIHDSGHHRTPSASSARIVGFHLSPKQVVASASADAAELSIQASSKALPPPPIPPRPSPQLVARVGAPQEVVVGSKNPQLMVTPEENQSMERTGIWTSIPTNGSRSKAPQDRNPDNIDYKPTSNIHHATNSNNPNHIDSSNNSLVQAPNSQMLQSSSNSTTTDMTLIPLQSPPTPIPNSIVAARGPQENVLKLLHHDPTVLESFRAHPGEFGKQALIFTKAEEVLYKRLKSSKSPILFVVLPDQNAEWTGDPLGQQLRVHFLCECGQDSTVHSTHLVQSELCHPGYVIRRPADFFAEFGPYLTVMLETLKLGVNVGDHCLEAVTLATENQLLVRIERALMFLEAFRVGGQLTQDLQTHQVYYRKLKQYLVNVQYANLGNISNYLQKPLSEGQNHTGGLYRIMGINNRILWVCQHHRQLLLNSSTNEKALIHLIKCAKLANGSFRHQQGYLCAAPTSSQAASDLYDAIVAIPEEVQEMDLTLDWNQDYEDLVQLRRAIVRTKISSIVLDLKNHSGPEAELEYKGRCTPIIDIMRHTTIRTVQLQAVKGLWSRSIIPQEQGAFSNLRKLSLEWLSVQSTGRPMLRSWNGPSDDLVRLKDFLSRAKNLIALDISVEKWEWAVLKNFFYLVIQARIDSGAPKKPTEFIFQPIGFAVASLRLSVINGQAIELQQFKSTQLQQRQTRQGMVDGPSLADFTKTYGSRFSHVGWAMTEEECSALIEATATESRLATLWRVFKGITDNHCQLITKLVAQSSLSRFAGTGMTNRAVISVLGAIYWNHLTTLYLSFADPEASPALQMLVDCVTKNQSLTTPLTGLLHLALFFEEQISILAIEVLIRLVKILSVETLALCVSVPMTTWSRIVSAINYSSLEWLHLSRHEFVGDECGELLELIVPLKEGSGWWSVGKNKDQQKSSSSPPLPLTRFNVKNFGTPTKAQVSWMRTKGIELEERSFRSVVNSYFV